MKENWNKPLESFEDEIKTIEDNTKDPSILEGIDKNQTLKEFLKKDKTKLRAFLSILKKADNNEENEIDVSKEIRSIKIIDALDNFVEQYKKGEHATLEPRQIESLVKILTFLRSGRKRGFLELPTGLGKTVIFSELIEAIKDTQGIKILVVGSGNINAIQNSQKIEIFSDEEVGQYFAGKKDLSARVTVCNYHGLRNAIKKSEFTDDNFDLVLLDEVHDGLGEVTQESINKVFKQQVMIGFTATATYELSSHKTVENFLPVEIDKMEIVEAVEENLLSAFDVEIVGIPNDINSLTVSHGDYDVGELNKAINTDHRNNLVVDSYIDFYKKKGNKVIAFCVGIQHAKDLAQRFLDKGVSAAYMTGKSTIDERESVLKKLKDGTIEVLCGSKLVWQSLDETEVNIGLNVVPSLSEKDVIQRGGRLLRRSTLKNNKRAKIVEFLDEWRGTKNRPVFYSELLQVASAQPRNWKGDKSDIHTEDDFESITESFEENEEKETTIDDKISEPVESPEPIESTKDTDIKSIEPVSDIEKIKKPIRYTSAKTIMSISNENRKFRNEGYLEYAPKGWMSSNIIAVEIGVSTREVDKAIFLLQDRKVRGKKMNSRIYLSALGIKRNFYDSKSVNEIYLYFTKSTRDEKVRKGEIPADKDFEILEQESLDKENKKAKTHNIDLDWKDYDLTPSFTLSGESLDDELENTNIYDTSELHPESESIDGESGDLTPYDYYKSSKGKVYNSKVKGKKNKKERIVETDKVTKRYGLVPDLEIENAMLNNVEHISTETSLMKPGMQDEILKIIQNELTWQQKEVTMEYFFGDHDGTYADVGEKFDLSVERIRQIVQTSIRSIAKKMKRKDKIIELKWKDAPEEDESLFKDKKEK